jgi:L-aspartate N-monooxygenase (nitrosuccinate-forming)
VPVPGRAIVFSTDLWPLIAKEVQSVYYATLLAARGDAGADGLAARCLAAEPGPDEEKLLDTAGICAHGRWNWERIAQPYGARTFGGPADFRAWLLGHLAEDALQARIGPGAAKATT